MKNSVAAEIADFVRHEDARLSSEQKALIERMRQDSGLMQHWARTLLREPSDFNPPPFTSGLLWCVLEAKRRADAIQTVPSFQREIESQFGQLLLSVETLSTHLREKGVPEIDNDDLADHIKERNINIRGCLAALEWAQEYISEERKYHLINLERQMPASQKLVSENTPFGKRADAFSLILCCLFENQFGQQWYSLSAEIADVAYQTESPVNPENVRRMYQRDRGKRLKG